VTKKNTPKKKVAAAKKKAAATPVLQFKTTTTIQVKHLDQPPKVKRPTGIHARHLLPLIRTGAEREFHSTTAQAEIRSMAMLAPMAATDELTIATNTPLDGPGQQQVASNVGEPSVAANGDVVFMTGNWYAAMSSDGGKTFSFIDPAKQFPSPNPDTTFCCDQVVQYIQKIDMFVWLQQYGPSTGDNIQRLALATTADVVKGKWRLFDVTTKALDAAGAFMDFPDLAVGANCLYMTTNLFFPDNTAGSGVLRIPFAGLQGGPVTAQPFTSRDLQSFRVAQNCGKTAYFAAHQDTSTLSVFSWDESQKTPVPTAVGVARWIGGNGYQSRTPDGRRWLDRADPRLTGATMTGSEVWFAWAVDQNSNHRPNPFIQIARIDVTNLTLLENINVFDNASATCYGALNTNANGEVGISYMIGGGPLFPSHVIGILTGTRKDVVVASSDRGPLDPSSGKGEWGDYLTVRPLFPDQKLFAATGYTMIGPGDGSNQDATPRFVVFGRSSDTTGGPGAVIDARKPGAVGGPAFTDVNALPVVNATVAAAIKAAAMAEGNLPDQAAAPAPLRLVTKPGVERWPVKTGTDSNVAAVGKNVINGQDLGAGIVEATVEELIAIPRPPGMRPATANFDSTFHDTRLGVVEFTVWVVEAQIVALKQETDGDYHLVLQGATGERMVAEVPTPMPPFVDASSPWLANIKVARKAVDDKLVSKLSPQDFVQMGGTLVPRESLPLSLRPQALAPPAAIVSFVTPPKGQNQPVATFKTAITPTKARITGVGFFDKVHGQMGVSLLNGIELHAVLKVEWI